MHAENNWETAFQAEIDQAEAARQASNEGMARVCARRAAGIAAGAYLQRRGLPLPGPSAVDQLHALAALPDTSAEIQEIISHLLIKVTPEFTLPIEADLVDEARVLKQILLGD
jgi:hypothetical protein